MSTACAHVTRFLQKMRGRSQSFLAEASDGFVYVVKFPDILNGPNALFNEAMGTELYREAGLPVPSWRWLRLSKRFSLQNPSCWVETLNGLAPPPSDICFGSRFFGGPNTDVFEILPGNYIPRVLNREDFWTAWLLDVCAGHSDNRQALFVADGNRSFKAVFIDQGHMFGGPNGVQRPHFAASRYYLDPRIYPDVSLELIRKLRATASRIDNDRVWQCVHLLPDDWKTHSALSNLKECLDTVKNPRLIEKIADLLSESAADADITKRNDIQPRRKPPNSVLRIGIPRPMADRPLLA